MAFPEYPPVLLDKTGIFKVSTSSGVNDRCQPYLIRFKDYIGLKGRVIPSDDLYFELGSYPYPLPSNSIQGMSFCTLTPGESDILLSLFQEDSELVYEEIIFRPEKARTILETINAEIGAMDRNLIYCIDEFSLPTDEVKETVSASLTKMGQQIKEHSKAVFLFLAISKDDLSFFKEHLPESNILYFNFDKILGKIAYPEEI